MAEEGCGTLYLVATPIGNLEDITRRALKVLSEVDYIAAEDTRTTRKLLSVHGIHTPAVSYHEQGARRRGPWLLNQIRDGRNVALVSEAGTPGISDPGFELVQLCLAEGVEVVAIPGPSVLLAALSVSGLPTDRFAFEGFLPRRRSQRVRALEALAGDARTLVFFESPRRVVETLSDLREVLGDRRAAVARELTKAFEEVRRGSLGELLAWAQGREMLGEVTLLVQGRPSQDAPAEELRSRVRFLKRRCRLADRDVVRVIQEETGIPRKVAYQAVLEETRSSE
jgi:16S rRNA (cytidine1402-2'-O)-methyltransferase